MEDVCIYEITLFESCSLKVADGRMKRAGEKAETQNEDYD